MENTYWWLGVCVCVFFVETGHSTHKITVHLHQFSPMLLETGVVAFKLRIEPRLIQLEHLTEVLGGEPTKPIVPFSSQTNLQMTLLSILIN